MTQAERRVFNGFVPHAQAKQAVAEAAVQPSTKQGMFSIFGLKICMKGMTSER